MTPDNGPCAHPIPQRIEMCLASQPFTCTRCGCLVRVVTYEREDGVIVELVEAS